MNNKGYLKYIFPTIIIYSLVTILPLVYLVYLSMQKLSIYKPGVVSFVGINNYITLLKASEFWDAIVFTFVFTISSVVIEFILGLAIAVLFNRNFIGIRFLRSVMIIPMIIAPILVAITWKMAYDPGFGIINYFLSLIGIVGPQWVSSAKTAGISIVLVDVWQWTPYMFFVFTSGLKSIPEVYYEASRIDGATMLQSFRYITIPSLQKVMMVAVIFRFMGVFRAYDLIFGLTGGGPGNATSNAPFYAYKLGFVYDSMGEGAAVSVLLLILILVICYNLSRFLGELWGGEKSEKA